MLLSLIFFVSLFVAIPKLTIDLLILFISTNLPAQNLIQNGSFEKYNFNKNISSVEKKFENNISINGWYVPLICPLRPYYYSNQEKFPKDKSYNAYDIKPADGNAYVILCVVNPANNNGIDSRSFVSAELVEPLKKDKKYHVEYKINKLGLEEWKAVRIGMYIGKTDKVYLPSVKPTIYLKDSTYISKSNNWMTISEEYTAKGNEKWMLIGNFFDEETTSKYWVDHTVNIGLDKVCISEIDNKGKYSCDCDSLTINIVSLIAGDKIQLENIYFETGKYSLLQESNNQLDELFKQLKENSKIKIEISGHTDNSGDEKTNQILSENRAKAVFEYLVSKGIDSKRIEFKGYGSTFPIADNQTNEGREKNRRVEIKILEN